MKIKTHRVDPRVVVALLGVLAITAIGNRLSSNDWMPKPHTGDYIAPLLDLSGAEKFRLWPALKGLALAVSDNRFPVAFDELRIDIKFKHLKRLREDRRKALEINLLHDATTVPAVISFKGRQYGARLRLKGDLPPHWYSSKRWSFRIRLQNGETINRASQFSLQVPSARQFPFDQIFHDWGRRVGNLEPGESYYRVYVNGSHWGIMLAEEHMTRHFLETNGRKEAPIIRFSSEESWFYIFANKGLKNLPKSLYGFGQVKLYNDRRYRDDRRMIRLYSYVVKAYRALHRGELPTSSFLDIDQFSRLLIRAMIWNQAHTLDVSNSRYYLNPYSLKLVPVSTDQAANAPLKGNNAKELRALGFKGLPRLYRALIKTPEFKQGFEANLDAVVAALPSTKAAHKRLCSLFPLDCPGFDVDMLHRNAEIVREYGLIWLARIDKQESVRRQAASVERQKLRPATIPDGVLYPGHIHAELYDNGVLRVFNPLPEKVRLVGVTLKCRDQKKCQPKTFAGIGGEIPPGRLKETSNFRDFKLPAEAYRYGAGEDRYVEIKTDVRGAEKTVNVTMRLATGISNPLLRRTDLSKFPFLRINGGMAYIGPGRWQITAPLILPPGTGLTIAPGATLEFSPLSYLLVQGVLIAKGSLDAPIRLRASGGTWKGVYVVNAKARSQLAHLYIEKTTALTDGALMLTGGVTFYRSDADLSHVSFLGSRAEDALNIVHSKFTINASRIADTISDGLDIDFGQGDISGLRFERIGGDGLDISGSDIRAENLSFDTVTDKAVSSGEQSRIVISSMQASNVGTGIVSKDGSITEVDGLSVTKFKLLAGMAYEKKNFYGSASLKVTGTKLPPAAFRSQTGHRLSVNDRLIAAEDIDVDALYKVGAMRKNQGVAGEKQ